MKVKTTLRKTAVKLWESYIESNGNYAVALAYSYKYHHKKQQ